MCTFEASSTLASWTLSAADSGVQKYSLDNYVHSYSYSHYFNDYIAVAVWCFVHTDRILQSIPMCD